MGLFFELRDAIHSLHDKNVRTKALIAVRHNGHACTLGAHCTHVTAMKRKKNGLKTLLKIYCKIDSKQKLMKHVKLRRQRATTTTKKNINKE